MSQIQPEALYVVIALLVVLCLVMGGLIAAYMGMAMLRRARDGQFGNPDRWVMTEVKNRITRQRREAAVDALVEELKPGEVVVADE